MSDLLFELQQTFHGLFDRGDPIDSVTGTLKFCVIESGTARSEWTTQYLPVVQVDIIRSEPAQTAFDRLDQVLWRGVILSIVVLVREFGGQKHFATGFRSGLEVSAEHVLVVAVHVCS